VVIVPCWTVVERAAEVVEAVWAIVVTETVGVVAIAEVVENVVGGALVVDAPTVFTLPVAITVCVLNGAVDGLETGRVVLCEVVGGALVVNAPTVVKLPVVVADCVVVSDAVVGLETSDDVVGVALVADVPTVVVPLTDVVTV